MIKVIIAGSREFDDLYLMNDKMVEYYFGKDIEVVCGEARGADTLGKIWAKRCGFPVVSFPADWSKGKRAGYIRNIQMGDYADELVAFWNGESRGTKHMIDIMQEKGKTVHIVRFDED